MGSVAGLDTLRFFAAAWVALFHGARFPLDKILAPDSLAAQVLIALNNGLFDGVASVMLFFVISGYVIHRAAFRQEKLAAGRFLLRRLTRVIPPVVILYLACHLAGPDYEASLFRILWSLYCEIAYYLIYPLLFLAFKRGWTAPVLVLSTLAAVVVLLCIGPLDYYWEAPTLLLMVIGLPNWILGCLLAERRGASRPVVVTPAAIWAWRLGAIVLSALLKALVSHGPFRVGYPESHWIIALYAFFWVGHELDFYRFRAAPSWFEAAGRASFSLYLVHGPILELFGLYRYPAGSLGFGAGALLWLAQLAAIGLATWLFYLVIEAPYHRFARKIGASPGKPVPRPGSREKFRREPAHESP
jgi:peptidoglycan/LPS O-acetylase OafA/YrhL